MRLPSWTLSIVAACALAACSSGETPAATDGGGGTGAGGTGGTGGSNEQPRPCTSSSQCGAADVCDPATRTCTAEPVACAGNEECGPAAICTAEGRCSRNATGGPCGADEDCPAGESCTGGFCGCAGDLFAAEPVAPNVMIVLDKSGSMRDPVGGTPKWDIALSAIDQLLAAYGDDVRFGLVLYPNGSQCTPGTVRIDVDDGTAPRIRAALEASGPGGRTPTGASLDGLIGYAGLSDPSRDNYVLLVTDGDETCGGDGPAAAAALLQSEPEVKTFVVGFGGEVDAEELDATAVAGGTALPGSPRYYQADDAASLAAAFVDIGRSVLSCSYQLSGAPQSADDLFVYFDGEAVQQDASEAHGWTWDRETNQVTFHGAACTALRGGLVADLVIVHGCPIHLG